MTDLHKQARLAGGALIGAMVVMLTGASIGFLAPSLREAPWTDDLQEATATIAGNPEAYEWANGLILAAGVLTALVLVPFSSAFEGKGRVWAQTGLLSFAFAAMFGAIDRLISIQVYAWAAGQKLDVTEPAIQAFVRLQGGCSQAFYALGFLSLILYGFALLNRPKMGPAGWLFAGGGLLGVGLQLADATIPAMVFFGTGALGAIGLLFGDFREAI